MYIGTKKTFQRLIEAPPEELVSSFQVGHGMLLNVLSREYEDGCAAMRSLLRTCHETPATRAALRRRSFCAAALYVGSRHSRVVAPARPVWA
ncbi:MAG: DUF3516 domain-containing protein [Verrucomicrobia bacterium]|nr:DUF3516 domain-containing protein [Verrucomicrobiota bacterium]